MPGWFATFGDLQRAGVSLSDWLEFHRDRRVTLTGAQRLKDR